MKRRTGFQPQVAPLILVLAAALAWMIPVRGFAAGLLIADGGFGGVLEIREHDVQVTINNGIAVTQVDQLFVNTEKRQVEALYTFPVPKGASVADFSMWIDGKEMVGEVLEKQRAREIYDSYKRKRRDPGLLEQVDYKTFEMRIFPIGPEAQQRVRITYYQELNVDHDRATYVYPLATATRTGVDNRVSGRFAIDLEIKSAVPITEIDSPSHGQEVVTAAHRNDYVQASLEAAGGSLARDVVVSYQVARPRTGIDLITSKTAGEDGYFSLILTAGKDLEKLERGMDYVFVLDISGSMANDGKLLVSKASLNAFIDELEPADRFEVMTFNLAPETLFNGLEAGDAGAKARADAFLESKRARGGTVLSLAMNTAYGYGDPDRPLNVVILSDGLTEQAERAKLSGLIRSRPGNTRVFCIGVGNEVNRPLLAQLAENSGGLAAFISRGDDFQRQARAFRRKLMRPVASDLSIDFGGLRVYDIVPDTLPDLFHGAPVRIYGRYAGGGEARVTLTGDIQGQAFEETAPLLFPERDPDNPEIERMWAWHRVDRLLRTADMAGDRGPVIDEIIRLGETFSIVTEYTAFLVLENDAEYRRWQIERKNQRRLARDREARERRHERLAAIRDRAISRLGPQPEAEPKDAGAAPDAPAEGDRRLASSDPNPAAPAVSPQGNKGRGFDFSTGGSGPVGPLFVGLAWWLRRRRKNGS